MAEPLPALRATPARGRRAPRSVEHPAPERAGVDRASKQAALRFLRGAIGVMPQVLVALHRVFVDPRMVARLVEAHRQGAPLARDVSPLLDDPRWLVEDPAFAWTPAQEIADRAVARELSALVEQLEIDVQAQLEGHRRLKALRDDSSVSGVSELAAEAGEAANDAWHKGGALLHGRRYAQPFLDRRVRMPDEAMWQEVLDPLSCARVALAETRPPLKGASAALRAACRAFSRCHRRLYEYRVRMEGGALLAADGIAAACNALVCCLAATPAAGAIFTARLALTLAMRAATATAAESLVARVGMVAQGVDAFDGRMLLLGTLEDAACNFVSTLVGGALTRTFSKLVGGFLLRRLDAGLVAALVEANGIDRAEATALALTRGWQMIVGVLGSTAGALLADSVTIVVHDIRVLDHIPGLDELMARLDAQLVHNGLATLLVDALGAHGTPVAVAR